MLNSRTALKLALWGGNGHQIHRQLADEPGLELVAFGAFDEATSSELRQQFPNALCCESYDELLAVSSLQLVSLCSPLRSEQAGHAITALAQGISVYAEKPCALSERDLDRIITAAKQSSGVFHEMAGTIFEQPYWQMAKSVQEGLIGEVIQVCAQKSYPMYPGRPVDEGVDGGLLVQNGVHAMRFIEHITGLQANSITAVETGLGENRPSSDLKMAAAIMGSLENGAIFSANINYLNQPGLGRWGNEVVKVFGSKGFIESIDSGTRVTVVLGESEPMSLELEEEAPNWLQLVLAHVQGDNGFPFDLETELHPTRMLLRAKEQLEGKHA